MNPGAIGVKQFIAILNETLSFAYPLVTVEGEVGSFKVNQGKWVFFDLKDEDAVLNCFMPLGSLKVPLEDGMKVRVSGVPKLTKWGKFSFTARTIELAGEGELRRAFELLKAKLGDEGLFDEAKKRPLPKFPKIIGLVASEGSAAYQDFVKILNARWQGVKVMLADVQVQGAAAPDQIVAALDYFNVTGTADILVLIRGGGSLEDLQAFNTEAVARAVAASRTPICVGVGHEVDTSLADLAADLRAATPTDAARLVVPDKDQINQLIGHLDGRLAGGWSRQLAGLEQLLDLQTGGMLAKLEALIGNGQAAVATLARVLAGHSPQATLERGYAIVTRNGQVIKKAATVKTGQELVIQLAEGKLGTKVI